jgi:hypothetical protein
MGGYIVLYDSATALLCSPAAYFYVRLCILRVTCLLVCRTVNCGIGAFYLNVPIRGNYVSCYGDAGVPFCEAYGCCGHDVDVLLFMTILNSTHYNIYLALSITAGG